MQIGFMETGVVDVFDLLSLRKFTISLADSQSRMASASGNK